MHYLIVVAWALLSLLAYIGYGYYPLRLAGVEPRWPFAGTIGIGFVIALGGVLNLMKGLTRPALIAIVICGAVLWLLAFRNQWGRIRGEVREFWRDIIGNRWKSAISVLLLTLLAASFFGNIITYRFKLQDDLVAYGDYAVQTAELGTLPANPFGERRIQSSLGSGYLLQAITLVVGDVRSLYVPDISLGFLLAVGAVYLIARRRLGRGVSLLLASLVFVLCFLLINASFYILPEALVLTLCWLGIDSPNDSARWLFRCALIGITAAALASLKSTYLPFSFFFCLFLFASYLFTFRRAYIALGGLICAGSAFAVLFPWMLDQHRKESTWLFPILGKGFDASAYPGLALPSGHAGLLAMRWTVWKYSLPFLTIWAVTIVLLLVWRKLRQEVEWPTLVALAGAAALGTFAIISATGGDSITRYTGPTQIPSIIVMAGIFLGWLQSRRLSQIQWRWFMATVGALACIFLWNGPIRQGMWLQYPEFVLQQKSLEKNRIDYWRQVQTMDNIQSAIPPGATVLVVTIPSYAFNVRRNHIFVDDLPGGSGPPPGPPITTDSEQLRSYLLHYGIDYIAFTRGYTAPDMPANMPIYIAKLREIIAHPSNEGVYTWQHMQNAMMSLRGAQIRQLSQHYRIVFDDGANVVIDLDHRK